jgi:hypothetical protein
VVDHKCYIQHDSEIHQHKLWRLDGFWEDALLQGVQAQMDMMESVLWDELEPEHLKEKVIGENVQPTPCKMDLNLCVISVA